MQTLDYDIFLCQPYWISMHFNICLSYCEGLFFHQFLNSIYRRTWKIISLYVPQKSCRGRHAWSCSGGCCENNNTNERKKEENRDDTPTPAWIVNENKLRGTMTEGVSVSSFYSASTSARDKQRVKRLYAAEEEVVRSAKYQVSTHLRVEMTHFIIHCIFIAL